MPIQEIITEARRNIVILIDFQPAYASHNEHQYASAFRAACNYINRTPGVSVIAFLNEEDLSGDTLDSVIWHYIEDGGLDEDKLDSIEFRVKSYAFLRNWMDHGVDESTIAKAVREMLMSGQRDSRDTKFSKGIQRELERDGVDPMDNINIPDIALGELRTFSGALMGGGGKSECYAEMQILLSALNIKYKEVQEWIYGG